MPTGAGLPFDGAETPPSQTVKGRPVVAAVVVTKDRGDVLRGTLSSLVAQGPALASIVVVDSGSRTAPVDIVGEFAPQARLVVAGDNVGFGAGLALGMRACREVDPDYFWLLDDDSPLLAGSLDAALELLRKHPDIAVLGNRGGHIRYGLVRHRGRAPARSPLDVDFCLVDGALVRRDVVRTVGYPREDFFMMFEDIEYTDRVRRAGYRLVISDAVQSRPMHLGSQPSTVAGPRSRWRLYYQSRNHLRMALDRRDPLGVLGCLARESAIVLAAWRSGDRGATARLVGRGLRDGWRRRMGRTLEPGTA
jgi:GT2 family glycosyltransferase